MYNVRISQTVFRIIYFCSVVSLTNKPSTISNEISCATATKTSQVAIFRQLYRFLLLYPLNNVNHLFALSSMV